MRLTKSKRLKFAIIVIAINLTIGMITLFVAPEVLVAMGTFLLMSNSPLYTYIIGETIRKSYNKAYDAAGGDASSNNTGNYSYNDPEMNERD